MKRNVSCLAACALAVALLTSWPARAQNIPPGATNSTLTTVSVHAPDASASEAGDPGRFLVSRGERTNGVLQVWLQLGGTAMNGLDYQVISNIVVIPDGARGVEITLTPLDDARPESGESAVLRIVPSLLASPVPSYNVGLPSSATVTIADNDPVVESNRPPVVNIIQPMNGVSYPAGANIGITSDARDTDGSVTSVEIFANNHSLGLARRAGNAPGTISSNIWFLMWSNAPAGEVTLAARAADDDGATALSAGVRILVISNTPPPPPPASNRPPEVRLVLPLDGSRLTAPATIGFAADARDPDGTVAGVDFFANGSRIGQGVRSTTGDAGQIHLWYFSWSNVPPGEYTCTARATDNLGAAGISAPVRVGVGTNQPPPPPPPTNNEPVLVTINAVDPHASEGLVLWASNVVVGVNHEPRTNRPGVFGTNNAVFTVRRSGPTNNSLRVHYGIGGTASNGTDFAALSGIVTVPAGRRSADIVVAPIDDALPERLETVMLRLRLPPLPLDPADSPYTIGRPESAAAFIVDNDTPAPPPRVLPDGMFHVCDRITNGCFRVEATTNLVHWEIICTNAVADGVARHIDPDAANHPRRFFRMTPVPCPPAQP